MHSSTATPGKKNRIIWAVDPSQNPESAKNLIREMKVWARQLRCEVQPVSIFSKSALTFNFPVEMSFPWKENFEQIAQKSIDRYLKAANATGFLPAELVIVPTVSYRGLATEMASYAERKNAQLIFVNTQARKTWNPFRLGGFTETLIATSNVPVLLLNPNSLPTTDITSILFPTDFSRESKNGLNKLVPWAKAFNSEILLFNQVETPNLYSADFNTWPTPTFMESTMEDVKKLRIKKAGEWSNLLRRQNINSSVLVKSQKKSLAEEIVELAKKNKISLIALASHSGLITQRLLGSVARDVLLQARCPVLIFHRPKASRKPLLAPPIRSSSFDKKPGTTPTEVQHG